MKKENLLVVCFDIKDFDKINKINKLIYNKIIVASDDFRVHEACKEVKVIDDVAFLQKPIPYVVVAKDVISFIEKINLFYGKLSESYNLFDKHIMEWPFHVEGGDTSQIIQNILLYIESLENIEKIFEVSEIIILENNEYQLLKNVLIIFCKKMNLKISFIKSDIGYFSKKEFKYFIRPYYYLFKTIVIKLSTLIEPLKIEKNVALIWLFSKHEKHVNNTFWIDDIMKKSGFNSIVYTWRIKSLNDPRIRQDKINIQKVEKYLLWKDIISSLILSLKSSWYRKEYKKEYRKYTFEYKGFNISDILEPTVLGYIYTEVSDNFRFNKAFENFNNYLNIKIINGDISRQKLGKNVENILDMNELNKFSFSTFLTANNIYVDDMRRRYDKEYWDKYIFFVQNDMEKNNLLSQVRIPLNNLTIYGSFRMTAKRDITKKEAKSFLNIKKDFEFYILFDFPHQLNGYQSLEEVISVFNFLIRFIEDKNMICLIVKPHPSANIEVLNIIKNKYLLSNVVYMNKKSDPIYGLTLANFLITKYSTLGIEAIMYDVIVLSIQLDNSNAFKLYGNAGNYIYDLNQLEETLLDLVWRDSKNTDLMLQSQQKFYKENFMQNIDYDLIEKSLYKFKNLEKI